MSNTILEGLVKEKDYTFKKLLFKIIKDFNLSLSDLLLLVYFLNQDKPSLNVKEIQKVTLLEEKDILSSYASLSSKGLILINIVKDKDGLVNEVMDLSNLYKAMVSDINITIKQNNTENIFTTFEHEFGRTLSPIEFEIINAWLKSGMSEELIIGALKEATYNGVSNLRYIDKILYEWGKKGFKNMNDVNNHLNKKDDNDKEPKVLFDYNWLDDEDE
jgi:DNA replication protein